MLQPSTAKSGRSIWDNIGRETFESHVDALSRTRYVPNTRVLHQEDWPKETNSDGLPFRIERQLCDDFAFIAAFEYGVGYVTAATIELAGKQLGSFTLRLAANEGICGRAKSAIEELLSVLGRCARKELSREQCAEEVLDTVVKLNNNRILGRLASRFFQPPLYDRGRPRRALSIRLKEELASCMSGRRSSGKSADTGAISAQTDAFHSSFLQLENSEAEKIGSAIKLVVKEAFAMTVDGFSLPARLGAIGFTRLDTREIREVNKIANYWRICRSLAHLSRSYRVLFTRPLLKTIEPYKPTASESVMVKRFVHAEIQMVTFYETCFPLPWPRAIGASKEACFLCDAFVVAHGHFYLSKAHRQVFHQWAVPDLDDYGTATLERFRKALATVDQTVLKELKIARRSRGFQPFPLQSSINLHKLMLPTPSMTTIRSLLSDAHRSVSPIALIRTSKPATPVPGTNPPDDKKAALDGKESTDDLVNLSSITEQPHEVSSFVVGEPSIRDDIATEVMQDLTTPVASTTNILSSDSSSSRSTTSSAIFFTSTVSTSLDWLSLHIELEGSYLDHSKNAANTSDTARVFSRAGVHLTTVPRSEAVSDEQKVQCFSMGDLNSGEEIVITRKEDDYVCAQPEATFMLLNGSRDPVRISCRWYDTCQKGSNMDMATPRKARWREGWPS